jgi:predicted metal-dependent enzyme (double-stranded beta helix superfamily)
MGQVLDQFAAECHDILKKDSGLNGLEQVCEGLKKVLVNEEFINEHLGPDTDAPRNILYEDPELGFVIVAHVHKGASGSPPHDHGSSWAIYGQVKGTTVMTEYNLVDKPTDGQPGKVKAFKSYDLTPGTAVAYDVGQFHSPKREGETRLVRIEGKNLDTIKRDKYEAV